MTLEPGVGANAVGINGPRANPFGLAASPPSPAHSHDLSETARRDSSRSSRGVARGRVGARADGIEELRLEAASEPRVMRDSAVPSPILGRTTTRGSSRSPGSRGRSPSSVF